MPYRTCKICGETKPETAEFFKPSDHCRGGLRPRCRDCINAHQREYVKVNWEDIKVRRRTNPNTVANKKASDLAYRFTPSGSASKAASRAKYAASDAGKMAFRLSQHRRRARLAEVRNDLTAEDWYAILAKFRRECAYCGATGDLFQEHVWPISKGGPNTAGNVVPACRPCNSRKFNTDMETWFRKQPSFTVERLAAILSHTAVLTA